MPFFDIIFSTRRNQLQRYLIRYFVSIFPYPAFSLKCESGFYPWRNVEPEPWRNVNAVDIFWRVYIWKLPFQIRIPQWTLPSRGRVDLATSDNPDQLNNLPSFGPKSGASASWSGILAFLCIFIIHIYIWYISQKWSVSFYIFVDMCTYIFKIYYLS